MTAHPPTHHNDQSAHARPAAGRARRTVTHGSGHDSAVARLVGGLGPTDAKLVDADGREVLVWRRDGEEVAHGCALLARHTPSKEAATTDRAIRWMELYAEGQLGCRPEMLLMLLESGERLFSECAPGLQLLERAADHASGSRLRWACWPQPHQISREAATTLDHVRRLERAGVEVHTASLGRRIRPVDDGLMLQMAHGLRVTDAGHAERRP